MALTLSNLPAIVELGGATEERYAYTTAVTLTKGDLVRINTSGTLSVPAATLAGAVSGIALADAAIGEVCPIVLFASDTVVKMSAIDAVVPATSLLKGVAYTLELGTNQWGVTATSTNGVALIVGYASTSQPWEDVTGTYTDDATVAGSSVFVRFSDATLSGSVAA